MSAMEQIGTAVAADAINKNIVAPLIQRIADLIKLSTNRGLLQDKLKRMKHRLANISDAFKDQQKVPEESIRECLKRTEDMIKDASSLISESQRCLNCLFATKMKEWNIKVDQLLQDLLTEISVFVNIQEMVNLTPQQPEMILQPQPDTGYMGSRIKDAEKQLQTWINAENPRVHVIGVYGMPGVGKTTLLERLYNNCKLKEAFDFFIWVKVSQDSEIRDLQCQIAEAISLDLSRNSSEDNRKMMLSTSLSKKKFLLILDDVWKKLSLPDLGVEIGTNKGSKVVFCSRDQTLMTPNKSIELKPLSTEDGWDLFQKVAFKKGDVSEDLKECARKFADDCDGLPLAITVVASAMASKRTVSEWNASLSLMQLGDPTFRRIHPSVVKELYGRLKWSYDLLSDPNLQNCFLYCAMYPKNPKIDEDILVRMWIAEGFVQSKDASYLTDMHIGRRYVQLLIDRFLFRNDNIEKLGVGNVEKPQNVWKPKYITVHDAVREMSIYIAEEEEKCFSSAGLQLRDFPQSQSSDCKRLSLSRNQINSLPNDCRCPNLVSLILSENPIIYNDRLESFLTNLKCLRVLDLSYTSIQSVPTSLAELTLLEFLSLKKTLIRNLPENICNLSRLQFLDLSSCEKLRSLPSTMENLTQLQYLNLSGMNWDLLTPLKISQLTSLKRLELYTEKPKALQVLTNLIELNVTINLKTGADEIALSVGTWLEMRHLSLRSMDLVAVMDPLPEMQRLKSLKTMDLPLEMERRSLMTLVCDNLRLKILPNFICEFQQLERLEFIDCSKLTKLCSLEKLPKLKYLKLKKCTELTGLEIGSSGTPNGFPMLQRLDLIGMSKLHSLVTPALDPSGLIQGTLPKLLVLKIIGCLMLKRLPNGMERLSSLETIIGEDSWWKGIFWPPNNDMKIQLQKLFRGYKII